MPTANLGSGKPEPPPTSSLDWLHSTQTRMRCKLLKARRVTSSPAAMGLPSPSASPPTSGLSDAAALRPLSLNQILRLHPRERLLVPPLQWTSRHLELLQCSFDPPSPAPFEQADHKFPYSERRGARAARDWAIRSCGSTRQYSVLNLLGYWKGPLVLIESVIPLPDFSICFDPSD